jgi:putative ATP-dependent endonuclease of OLD family
LVVFKSVVVTTERDSIGEPSIDLTGADAAVIGSGLAADNTDTDETDTDALTATMTAAALRRSTRCIP